jgi:histidinol-phosphate aminotransferase
MSPKSKTVYISLLKESVSGIPEYVPGKTSSQIAAEYGLKPEAVIKLNSNENPLGASVKVAEAVCKTAASASLYPTADASLLRNALTKYVGCPAENIVAAGPGMDSLIDAVNKLFVGVGDEVILPVPTFTYYGISAAGLGGVPISAELNPDFSLNLGNILKAVTDKTKIIYLCSPNNPTGNVISESDVRELAEKTNAILFIDEAYVEFSTAGSLVSLAEEYENIIIGRTFSKAFGLAGMRVGYVIAPEWIASNLLRVLPPFSVSILSEAAAVAALEDTAYMKAGVALIQDQRAEMINFISKETPYQAYASEGNFFIADVSPNTSKKATDIFMKNGVLIRSCDSFQNIGKNTVRITVGTAEMNQKVKKAFKALAAEK